MARDDLTAEYRRRIVALQNRAARGVGQAWGELGGEEFIAAAADLDRGSQQAAVGLADAYMAEQVAASTGETVAPLGVDPDEVGRRADPDEVWSRPGKQEAIARSRGGQGSGLVTAQQLIRTNTQLAARDTAHAWTSSDDRIVGYRRVLGPQRNCGLCVTASTQRYKKQALMPIHPHCACTVEPIVGDQDPGQLIDPERLEFVKSQADETTREALSRLRIDPDDLPEVAVREHGELGPTLSNAAHDFTGPGDIAA